ncbi:protein msta-like [Anoplophora glabripennis]|uniref:protein msta-like n=1 Tax=Anoplophora glabripennis TaxID=217634 RepID=UPI000873C44A|nr:protein msta-like [Anoplophora glabripennis]
MTDEVHFTIERDDNVGRYAVAKEKLNAGDIIFSEEPFAYGPKSDSACLCLGCHNLVDCTVLCSKCSWPVCGSDCENLSCHKNYECEIFSKANIKFQAVEDPSDVCLQYECITPLRVLLIKEKNPQRWEEEIQLMESHNDIRKQKPIWEFNQHNIVEYLRGPCKLDRFSEDLIHSVCGILEINAFEARNPSGYSTVRCLFPKLAILSHNCISNIHHAIDVKGNGNSNDYRVIVRAAVGIPKGGQLYSSYTYSLWPTLVRREFLRESKFFDCKCERCSDKTELGTHCGTLKCNKCDNGIIMSTNPLDDTCEWKCTHCEFKTNAVAVRKVFAAIQAEIDAVDYTTGPGGIEKREAIYRKYRSVLHPKNSYMSILRSALTQLYGKSDEYTLEDLPDIILERKVELCNQLLEVLNVIEPGRSRIRGITLYELHGPLMVLAKHQYLNDVITKEFFRNDLKKAIDVLGEAVQILKQEPENSPEGQLGNMAETAYKQLLDNIDMLVESA